MCQHQLTCFAVMCAAVHFNLLTRFWWAVAVKMVEAETDDLPVKHFMAPRNQYGQLCVASIKEYLVGSRQILVSIGQWLSCMQR